MESLINGITSLASQADEVTHKSILDAVRSLARSLERPGDTIQRLCYSGMEPVMAQIAYEQHLFEALNAHPKGASSAELAALTNSHPTFTIRFLRYLASVNMCTELSQDHFGPSNISHALVNPGFQAGLRVANQTLNPVFAKMPEFYAKHKYQPVLSNTDCPWNLAFGPEPIFAWMPRHADVFGDFMSWMTVQHEGMPDWLSVFPVEAESKGWPTTSADGDAEAAPLFVDVGGSIGHQCVRLKTKYPNLPGRIVLQDLPHATSQALPECKDLGIETMDIDFFESQPVKGARFYYLRNILHDYPDDKAKVILGHIREVMGPRSVILVDEMRLPDQGVHWQQAQLDMLLMSAFGAVERTEGMWEALFEDAGFRIEKVYRYTEVLRDSVTVIVPK